MVPKKNIIDPFTKERKRMVKTQIKAAGVQDVRVLKALQTVPRHLFVPPDLREQAYEDKPLPIGYHQTISQPYIVGFMSEALEVNTNDKILEIGTGSGYQASILSKLCQDVYTIEIVAPLALQAQKTFEKLRYSNIHCKAGDGNMGWPEASPFDAIIVTATCSQIPPALIAQLKIGGRLVMPLGKETSEQTLIRVIKTKNGLRKEYLIPVRFVPLTGKTQGSG
ncbi:MAG: protein-L-isoaspartate(D-aspartate) O-methyltransferase [Alphaproteobacteria bacterium]|nr:protein-L-isoaspartate(D-aspartate) O-methyltransferase [Alphaproteobacteria bacterium]